MNLTSYELGIVLLGPLFFYYRNVVAREAYLEMMLVSIILFLGMLGMWYIVLSLIRRKST